jgi:hypothetical protein
VKKIFNLPLATIAFVFLLLTIGSCKKNNDPNVLGGDTNIPLTQKDSATSVYISINGQNMGGLEIKVVSNDNGMVTYGATFDPSTLPDSTITNFSTILPQLINYYNPKDITYSIDGTGKLHVQFKLKITSEGMQSYFIDGKPWTVKYADPQGTNYNLTRDNGDVLTATVTEKTGQDDWPYGFMYIKTSKVEFNCPATDPVGKKVTYRVNHKFGLVYLKAESKDGRVIELDLFPWFLL